MAAKQCSDVRRQPDRTLNARQQSIVAIATFTANGNDSYRPQEVLDGKPVDWLEQVSDEQYQAPNVNQ
jgi:hypothetical protein